MVDSRVLFLQVLNYNPVQEKTGLTIYDTVLAQQSGLITISKVQKPCILN